jgi:hypothetical protein
MALGVIGAILGAWRIDLAVHIGGGPKQWGPSAASAAAAWSVLVLLVITLWQLSRLLTGGKTTTLGNVPTGRFLGSPVFPGLLLGLGIVIGFFLFK